MDKNLYNLMLMDSVVSEIDKICLREGTNRSNRQSGPGRIISLMTPEKRIDSIFRNIS